VKDGHVLGVGVDLVENERMEEMLTRWGARFKNKVFLKNEQSYCETCGVPSRHYAGRFAVKEAVSKAFGTGFGPHLNWLDIEVIRDDSTGAPSVKLSGKAQKFARLRKAGRILISLSHTRNYAVAYALLIGDGKHK